MKNRVQRKTISIVSTYATDRLIDAKTNQIIQEQKGGPILYIIRVLEKLGLQPKVYAAEEMLVEILICDDDEFGKIDPPRNRVKLPQLNTEFAIVSTILDEWDLSPAFNYAGKLFVDIQGYVRDGSAFGKKRVWNEIRDISPYIFCLKGNDVEIGMLPQDVVYDQKKNRMLIITKGREGAEAFYRQKYVACRPPSVIRPRNTIGAGDTFFASFVAKFMETNDIMESNKFALSQTTNFLKTIE